MAYDAISSRPQKISLLKLSLPSCVEVLLLGCWLSYGACQFDVDGAFRNRIDAKIPPLFHVTKVRAVYIVC